MTRRAPGEGAAPLGPADARLSAPSALRNRAALVDLVARIAPARGQALEIASGTGEHVVAFARACPGLTWQPTDPDPARRASIAAWIAAEGATGIAPPADLDATRAGWGTDRAGQALVVLVNLLHLLPEAGARTALAEIAAALAPGGRALVYGPFLRDGQATSDGDRAFDAALRAADPDLGYKDAGWVAARFAAAGLVPVETVAMPANNLAFVVARPGPAAT